MDQVQVDQKTYQMPPKEGFTIAHFLTVTDLKRSAEFYKTVFDGEIVSMGDGNAPPYIRIANTWLILNVGGGPTPDKPTVTLSTPPDPNHLSSFMNIRVADIHACYKLWKSRGATFSPNRSISTARRGAISAIPTVISSRLDRPKPDSSTAKHSTVRVDPANVFYREAGTPGSPIGSSLHRPFANQLRNVCRSMGSVRPLYSARRRGVWSKKPGSL